MIVARLVAALIALGLYRRQSLPKLLFNIALFTVEVSVAAAALRLMLQGSDPTSSEAWPAIFGALLISYVIVSVSLTAAITVFSGWPGITVIQRVFVFGSIACVGNTATALIIVSSVADRSPVAFLVAGIAVVMFVVYRAYMSLTERYKSLETLHDFTRRLAGAEIEELEAAAVQGAQEILRGEHGALLLPPVREGMPANRVLSQGDAVVRANISPTELAADLAILLPGGESRLFEPGAPLPGWLAQIGIKDAAIVPLVTDGVAVGAMVVANRLTEVSSFVDDDLRVFETLANHANVALANGRLVTRLQQDARDKEHLALHDPVTGLPNRLSMESQLDMAVADARVRELGVALVFVDLDTFKEVNDTLGTATGDRLLVEVRERLERLVPADAVLTRFTGDQFAVLVPGVTDPDLVLGLAETLHADFDTPFTAGDVSLVLGASVGVAHYPEHATTAAQLRERADAATYRARLEGSGIEVYAAETDPYAPRRMALAADLREALEQDEVDVYVQPKLSLASGEVVGAEALVRWTHPRLGPLSPDQFIPAAEQTGVIRALTLYVVRHALAQCRTWRDSGLDLSISVNLSARNLFDTHLVDDIGAAIDESGVPASLLTLELTESTVMSESHRSTLVLEGLHDLGVGLSVDDFGTGYSSLTHLRNLPVTELKVDKSFVMTMTVNEQDAVIVRTLIDLGRSLGLRTVAEGVESAEAREMLHGFGCEEAQGYLFSRPLPAAQFSAWVARQPVRRLVADPRVIELRERDRRAANDD
ncbi:MAG: putative bifunctional diguanylate cyclase/phosphodiesterase [Acidimicrobiales bacterium]